MGSRLWPSLFSCSKMIWASTERVISLAGLCIEDDEVLAGFDHGGEISRASRKYWFRYYRAADWRIF